MDSVEEEVERHRLGEQLILLAETLERWKAVKRLAFNREDRNNEISIFYEVCSEIDDFRESFSKFEKKFGGEDC